MEFGYAVMGVGQRVIVVVKELGDDIPVGAEGNGTVPVEVLKLGIVAERSLETPVAHITRLHIHLGVSACGSRGIDRKGLVLGVGQVPGQIELEQLEETEIHTHFPGACFLRIEFCQRPVGWQSPALGSVIPYI